MSQTATTSTLGIIWSGKACTPKIWPQPMIPTLNFFILPPAPHMAATELSVAAMIRYQIIDD
jgi:hypothetical protein